MSKGEAGSATASALLSVSLNGIRHNLFRVGIPCCIYGKAVRRLHSSSEEVQTIYSKTEIGLQSPTNHHNLIMMKGNARLPLFSRKENMTHAKKGRSKQIATTKLAASHVGLDSLKKTGSGR
jgi:hypothetical protein